MSTTKPALETVFANVENAPEPPSLDDRQWLTTSLTRVMDQIAQNHHECAELELPRVMDLAIKVRLRHAYMYPQLNQLFELLETIKAGMRVHMLRQEQLFPCLSTMEQAACNKTFLPADCAQTALDLICGMMTDHEKAEKLLKSIRLLTHNYQLPEDACSYYHALYQGLTGLERDMLRQLIFEKDILFPRDWK